MYRSHAPTYDALSGERARLHGGRWNPPVSFAVVYTASDRATVDAELRRQLDRARLRPEDLRRRKVASIRVELQRVLDLRDAAVREALGVRLEEIQGPAVEVPRLIGDAAHELGYEAIVAPSAAGSGHVVAIFPGNRAAGSTVEVVSVRPRAPARRPSDG